MNKVYLDHAATSFIYPEVIEEMADAMQNCIGNPSSTHAAGQEAKAQIENTRKKIAALLNVEDKEIIFTSCGTEANNLIIRSCVENMGIKRIITSAMEHKCVLEASLGMAKLHGISLVFLKVDKDGFFSTEELQEYLEDDITTLVSLMQANNEVGNIYPIQEVAKICNAKPNVYLHSDTVQTVGHYSVDLKELGVDFASCSAHKFHGPKGVGFAYIRKNTKAKAMIFGGGQERNLRSGTENVYGILGMGKALEISIKRLEKDKETISALKKYTIEKLKKEIPNVQFNGASADMDKSLYTVLNVFVPSADPMLGFKLNMKGIAISQGSACSSGAQNTSMVMRQLRTDEELSMYSPIRISFSHTNTTQEIDYLVSCLKDIILMETQYESSLN